jgi:UDP-glucose 4-epimerase
LEYRVVIIDNLSSGKLKNLNPAAAFRHSDITQSSVNEVFQREQPDLVFHLAAQTSVPYSTREPVNDSEINVVGTLRILDAAQRFGVDKLIFSSTGGALYGDPEVDPCPDDHPVIPLSPYGMSKYIGEQYMEYYHRMYRLNFTSLRYGNVYGPRQDPHGEAGVVAIFSRAMIAGKQPEILGNGDQERDFVSVDDVVEANILAIDRGDGMHLNIGTGQKTSINTLFELLKSIIGYRWGPVHGPARLGDVFQISLDSARAAQEMGWTPQVDLEEGLRRTVDYFRQIVQTAR